jgi:S1-C subfamily serine protease
MKNYLVVFLCVLSLFVVGYWWFHFKQEIKPEDPAVLFDRYKGSVVLIVNEFYYEITAGEVVVYYSPNAENKVFTDEEEVKQYPSLSFGTGFVMSDDGKILTNRHVVDPMNEQMGEEVATYFTNKKLWLESMVQTTADTLEHFGYYFADSTSVAEASQRPQWSYMELLMFNEQLSQELEKISSIDLAEASYNIVYQRLGIAYNDAFITEADDLQECVVIRQSDNADADLAILQTKTKELMKRPQYFFDFDDHNPNRLKDGSRNTRWDIRNPVAINDPVYMIGYNHGLSIALTNKGIQSQFTSGNVSQTGNEKRLLYTIPTLEGSSGSPIIDQWGNLVAVNFAKISNTQGFSFGVPVHVVREFYEGQ